MRTAVCSPIIHPMATQEVPLVEEVSFLFLPQIKVRPVLLVQCDLALDRGGACSASRRRLRNGSSGAAPPHVRRGPSWRAIPSREAWSHWPDQLALTR